MTEWSLFEWWLTVSTLDCIGWMVADHGRLKGWW